MKTEKENRYKKVNKYPTLEEQIQTFAEIIASNIIKDLIMKKEKKLIVSKSSENVLPGKEKRLLELTLGAKPIDENETQLVKQIEQIKKSGGIVEIPSN